MEENEKKQWLHVSLFSFVITPNSKTLKQLQFGDHKTEDGKTWCQLSRFIK